MGRGPLAAAYAEGLMAAAADALERSGGGDGPREVLAYAQVRGWGGKAGADRKAASQQAYVVCEVYTGIGCAGSVHVHS
jgi:hypothetical protein